MKKFFKTIFNTPALYSLFRKCLIAVLASFVSIIFSSISIWIVPGVLSTSALVFSILFLLISIASFLVPYIYVMRRNILPNKVAYILRLSTFLIGFIAFTLLRIISGNSWVRMIPYIGSTYCFISFVFDLVIGIRTGVFRKTVTSFTSFEQDEYVKPHREYSSSKKESMLDESKVVEVDVVDK